MHKIWSKNYDVAWEGFFFWFGMQAHRVISESVSFIRRNHTRICVWFLRIFVRSLFQLADQTTSVIFSIAMMRKAFSVLDDAMMSFFIKCKVKPEVTKVRTSTHRYVLVRTAIDINHTHASFRWCLSHLESWPPAIIQYTMRIDVCTCFRWSTSRYTMRIAVHTRNNLSHFKFRVVSQCLNIHTYLSHDTTSWSGVKLKKRVCSFLICVYSVHTSIYNAHHGISHVFT